MLTVVHGLPDDYEGFGEIAAEAREASAQKQLPQFEQFLGGFDFFDVSWDKVIRYGEPCREILTVALETESDLLVMGSGRRTGFSRILVGGVARKVTREMPCSIVAVKSEHAIRLRLDAETADFEACVKLGIELLEKGFPEEALSHFQHCVAKDTMDASAWEGMAAAHRRLNRQKEADECKERATAIVQHFRT